MAAMDVVYRSTFLEIRDPEAESPSRRAKSEVTPAGSPSRRSMTHLAELYTEVRKQDVKAYFDEQLASPSNKGSPLRRCSVSTTCSSAATTPAVSFPPLPLPTTPEDSEPGTLDWADITDADLGFNAEQQVLRDPAASPTAVRVLPYSPPPTPTAASAGPTTLMLRNIPNKVTADQLRVFLDDAGMQNTYDVLHLPTDLKSGHNRGYAFVNFLTNEGFTYGMQQLGGLQFSRMFSRKVTEVCIAHVQGRRAIERIQVVQRTASQSPTNNKRGGRRS
mmetsp:Transcript_40045/g.91584  ORF Transcript_40045/g.91584 Transcript_40045/m.91584 type:complete len:276 (+) Transcript_40045:63-890(+)